MTSIPGNRPRAFLLAVVVGVLLLPRPAAAQSTESAHYGDAVFAHAFDSVAPEPAFVMPTTWQDPPQPPPKHHTGLQALVRTTAADFKAFPMRRSTFVILGIGAAAAALAHPADDDLNPHFAGSRAGKFFTPGKYLGYGWVQAGAATGTYVIGRVLKKTTDGKPNKVAHVGFDLLRANLLTQSLTYGVKRAVRRDRPTGECCSFPSGHASVTFAAAAVLERHFGYRNAWPTVLIASYVAASRLHENRHFASDVLFGAALGMASGWTVVGRHGREEFALLPVPTRGGVMVAITNPHH
jgi:membrane-associated phospholipid phosphatase